MKKHFAMLVFLLVLVVVIAGPVSAQQFPTRPIKVLATHGPGSTVDLCIRMLAPYFQKHVGVSVVVENMAGAAGRVMRSNLYKEQPDGYTLGITGMPSIQLGELLYKPAYKTMDFTFIYNFVGGDYGTIIVAKDSPYKNFKDLVQASQSKPVIIAVAGLGAADHMTCVMLRDKAKVNSKIVPFSGGDLMMAVLGKQVDAAVESIASITDRTDVRPLIVFSLSRVPQFPDAPTAKELGYGDLEVAYRNGIIGPPKMAPDRVAILEAALKKAVADPGFVAEAKKGGLGLEPMDSKEYRAAAERIFISSREIAPIMEKDIAAGQKK
jgi:tripartite-type tricarboxylate transporter receptor subunit TctC